MKVFGCLGAIVAFFIGMAVLNIAVKVMLDWFPYAILTLIVLVVVLSATFSRNY